MNHTLWQRQNTDSLINELFGFFNRAPAVDSPVGGFALMHGAGLLRKAVPHILTALQNFAGRGIDLAADSASSSRSEIWVFALSREAIT